MIKLLCTLAVLLPLATIDGFNIQPRIVKGITSKPGEFKFFATIYTYEDSHVCSAVLISDRWVLSAAHCLQLEEPLKVKVGLNELNEYTDELKIPVQNQYKHSGYIDSDFPWHDIGLLELPRQVAQSAYIQPVSFSSKCGTDLDNIDVIAIGNGRTSMSFWDTPDHVLRHAHLKTISWDECRERVKARYEGPYSVICTNPNDGAGCAPGDSGGPLVQRSDGSLIGITSFGDDEGAERPVRLTLIAFSRVHTYFGWIENVTGLGIPKCDE